MNALTGRQPYQKQEKLSPDPDYLNIIRYELSCQVCSRRPCEAHHCRDLPDYDEREIYKRIPGAAMKSHDHDAIPLCPKCHEMFHLERPKFHALIGKDYLHIEATRKAVKAFLDDEILGSWF